MSGFPNMAGKPDIDDALAAELEAAGIEVFRLSLLKNGSSEVDTEVRGGLYGWSFQRAWYYWRCNGPGIEVGAAERLHAKHGKDVRVAGHCGCPSPTEWYKGLAVGSYHVDTQAGLKALADTIKGLVERKSPEVKAPASPPDWKQDQAETTRIKPPATAEGGRGEPVAWLRTWPDGAFSFSQTEPALTKWTTVLPLYTHPASPPDVEAISPLDESAIRRDEREKCAAEVERANWPCVGDARRIASAIRTGGQK